MLIEWIVNNKILILFGMLFALAGAVFPLIGHKPHLIKRIIILTLVTFIIIVSINSVMDSCLKQEALNKTAATDKTAADKIAKDKNTDADQTGIDQPDADQATADKMAADQAAADKAIAEKTAADRAAKDAAEKAAFDKAVAENKLILHISGIDDSIYILAGDLDQKGIYYIPDVKKAHLFYIMTKTKVNIELGGIRNKIIILKILKDNVTIDNPSAGIDNQITYTVNSGIPK